MRAWLIAFLIVMAGASTAAQDGDGRRGLALASEACASCHGIRKGAQSRDPRAPPFEAIAAVPGMTGLALQAALQTSHREMPNQPVELVPLDSVYLEGPPHGFNMLAVPDAARVQGSAFRIVEGVSPKLLPHKAPPLHHPVGGF